MNYVELDKNYILNNYARFPVVFTKGKGSYLFDENGNKYLDFGSGIAVNGLGISPKKWKTSVIKQIKNIAHTSNYYITKPNTDLAKLLCEKTGYSKVFFSNSGAEANECAIKCARKYAFDKGYTNKNKIITLNNSFHGRTMATISATGQNVFHNYFFPFLEGFEFCNANDYDDFLKVCSSDVCAVIVELIQGEGGVQCLNKEFVKQVYNYCNSNDILFICDEVQTGNGRTGSLYAYMDYDILPDIITTAKGLANGLPIGATLFNKKTENVLTAGTHGSTFGGNPVSCAGGVEVIKSLTDSFLSEVVKKGEYIKEKLLTFENVESVSGKGLMLGITTKLNAKEVCKNALNKNLLVLTAKDKVRLLPPLNISYKDIDKGLNILKEVLK